MTKREAVRKLMAELGRRYWIFSLRHRLHIIKRMVTKPTKYDYKFKKVAWGGTMDCTLCDNRFIVFATSICNITKKIIHFPDTSGRFCEDFRTKRVFNHRCISCNSFTKISKTFVCYVLNKIIKCPTREGRFCHYYQRKGGI